MKKVLVVLMFAFFGSSLVAQNNEAELFLSVFKVEKKAILMEYLKLSETEAAAFWPIYNAFEVERANVARERIALMTKYAEQYNTLTAEQADILYTESAKWRASRAKLEQTYYKKFKKAVGAVRAAQFVQFERYVDTSIDAELYDNMPVIGQFQ